MSDITRSPRVRGFEGLISQRDSSRSCVPANQLKVAYNVSDCHFAAMYIFISYSSLDKSFVRRLADSLSFYDVPLFLDERHIEVGDNIKESIYRALERA